MKSNHWLRTCAGFGALCVVLASGSCAREAESKEIKHSAAPAASASDRAPADPPAPTGAAGDVAKDGARPAMMMPVMTKSAARIAASAGTADAVPAGSQTLGDASYSLTVQAPDKVSRGGKGVIQVSVVPKKGWKMNKEFPTKLTVKAPEGVTVAKPSQSVKDAARFDDRQATFAVEFTADAPGTKAFSAKFKFAVCTESTCDPKKQLLSWKVDVE